MNIQALKCISIAAACYQQDWIPGTDWTEVLASDPGFERLCLEAELNLQWMGLDNISVSPKDVALSLWDDLLLVKQLEEAA